MRRFEYLIAFVAGDRVQTANHNWQGAVPRGTDGDHGSCPTLVEWLTSAGSQGWELVAVDPEGEGTAQLYLKRER